MQLRFSGHVLDVPKMWSGGNWFRRTLASCLQGNLANKIYKISRAAPLRVGAIIFSSFVSIVIIYFLALRAEILLISYICACASLLSMCSAIDYHHSFRSFRAQSLNLMNVAVHISEINQSRCSLDSAHEYRSRRYEERW